VTTLAVGLAVAGVLWGIAADRIAARWPAHEDGSVRAIDWRTAVVALVGGAAMAALAGRFAAPLPLAIFVVYIVALVLLLATDLDQRLLPDPITLPLIPLAALVTLAGVNPLVPFSELVFAVGAALVLPLGLYLLSIPYGAGAIGMGDLKLMISVGLLAGFMRAFLGLLTGALLSGVVVAALLALRRVTLRTYIPFGPFLILGALVGILRA
jgi:leader peptidase (prepilin peptidase) / N-methyltransferase